MSAGQPRGDLLSAAFWAALGAAILAASWRMDRLTHQGINVWSAPGLLPGVVGLLMVLFALVLALQARRHGGSRDGTHGAGGTIRAAGTPGADPRQSGIAALLCLAFAGASLGHDWPFQLVAAVFIVLFTAVFRWAEWRASGRATHGLVQAGVVAAVAALAIGWLFESVFLVRLP